MDTLHLLGKVSKPDSKARTFSANFGVDPPRLDDVLHIDSIRYRVVQVERVLRDNGAGQLVQYERHVWAREQE